MTTMVFATSWQPSRWPAHPLCPRLINGEDVKNGLTHYVRWICKCANVLVQQWRREHDTCSATRHPTAVSTSAAFLTVKMRHRRFSQRCRWGFVFWDATPCCWATSFWRFEEFSAFIFRVTLGQGLLSDGLTDREDKDITILRKLVTVNQSTRRYITWKLNLRHLQRLT